MELNLKGKQALITGGSHGIGLAIKNALEVEGVEVINWDIKEGKDLEKKMYNVPDIDIIINNVGGGGSSNQWDWEYKMEMNLGVMIDILGQWLMYNKKWGRIITISSIFGKEKGPNAGFVASKSAQIAFMKCLAGDERYEGTTFNVICPGCINTKPSIKEFAEQNKMTLGEPEDVAGIVTFLCSDLAKHINGAVITCDGGDSHSF
jgi:3-oxoacyl-[acyl-carrier protein] reductase